jgi:tRNA U34 5-carboxymethylaminomethyl modifying GTPase MnmE/TrmE
MISNGYFKKLNFFIYKSFHSSSFHLKNQHLPSIYSLSSGWNGRSAVAVIRISGSKCLKVIEALTLKKCDNIESRKMYLRDFYDPITNEKIDKGLMVLFRGFL